MNLVDVILGALGFVFWLVVGCAIGTVVVAVVVAWVVLTLAERSRARFPGAKR